MWTALESDHPCHCGSWLSSRYRSLILIIVLVCTTEYIYAFHSPTSQSWRNHFEAWSLYRLGSIDVDKLQSQVTLPQPKTDDDILCSFPYRSHRSKQVSCSKIHRLADNLTLECEGLLWSSDSRTCGGLPLVPGLCVMPEKTKHKFDSKATVTGLREVSNICDMKEVKLDRGFFSNYRYHGPKCELADVNPRWLHDSFENKVIVFMGDSHARNLFTSFIAESRNQMLVVERHPDTNTKDTLFPYQVYQTSPQSDFLRDLTGSKSLSRDKLNELCKEINCCSVTVVFLWAGFPSEYETLLDGAMKQVAPDVIITDFVSKAYTTGDGFDLSMNRTAKAFEDLFATMPSGKVKLIVSPFPINGGNEVQGFVSQWLTRISQVPSLLVDQRNLWAALKRSGAGNEQLKHTSHTVCGLYDTFSLDPAKQAEMQGGVKVVGHETCVAPIDRAVVRAALTFAASV